MISIEEADTWIGCTAVDNTGEQFGLITQIWVDDASGEPEWASVRCIGLGGREALVPLAGAANLIGGRQFAYSKDQIFDAPHASQDGHLPAADKDHVASYYAETGPAVVASPSSWADLATGAYRPHAQSQAMPAQSKPTPAQDGDWTAPAPAPAPKRAMRRFGRKAAPSVG